VQRLLPRLVCHSVSVARRSCRRQPCDAARISETRRLSLRTQLDEFSHWRPLQVWHFLNEQQQFLAAEVKGPILDMALLTRWHIPRSAFTMSEEAADWHELMISLRIMRPSIARDAACRHTTASTSTSRAGLRHRPTRPWPRAPRF